MHSCWLLNDGVSHQSMSYILDCDCRVLRLLLNTFTKFNLSAAIKVLVLLQLFIRMHASRLTTLWTTLLASNLKPVMKILIMCWICMDFPIARVLIIWVDNLCNSYMYMDILCELGSFLTVYWTFSTTCSVCHCELVCFLTVCSIFWLCNRTCNVTYRRGWHVGRVIGRVMWRVRARAGLQD